MDSAILGEQEKGLERCEMGRSQDTQTAGRVRAL